MEVFIKSIFENTFTVIAETIFLVFIIAFVFLLILHIFGAIGLKKIADKKEKGKSWIAFIPILNSFLIGILAFKKRIMAYLFLILSLLSTLYIADLYKVLPEIAIVAILVITFIMLLMSLFNIYKSLSNKYIVMFIFTLLTVGLISPFLLFAIRKNNLIENE